MSDSTIFGSAAPSSVTSPNTPRTAVSVAPVTAPPGVLACGAASLLLLIASTASWFQTDDLLLSFTTPPPLRAMAALLGVAAGVLAGLMLIRALRVAAAVVAIVAGVLSFASVFFMIVAGIQGISSDTGFGTEVVHLQPQIGVVLAGLGTAAMAIGGVAALVTASRQRPPIDQASWVPPTAGT